MKGRGVYIKTFGCQMNEHDSERMLGILYKKGFGEVYEPKEADIIIFNTCAIREKAEHKFFSSLGRLKNLKKRRQNIKIVVAGCSAKLQGEALLKKIPFIDYVIGPDNIDKLEKIIDEKNSQILLDENPQLGFFEFPKIRKDKIKAWVNIIYGCNNFCSYCVVPFTRGRERSRPLESIINEIKELSEKGYKEITLLGQNVNSYKDGDINFPKLLEKIEEIKGIERIRFITSHPKDLSKELIEVMKKCSKICEHIHLPLQAGSDNVLKMMNRKYTYNEYFNKVYLLRENIPNIAITTDIIVGFPQEKDKDFEKTVRALEEIRFDGIFAFKFSPRPLTAASKLEGAISEEVKTQRLTQILSLQDEITEEKNKKYYGTIQEILIEGKNEEGFTFGRTRTNKIVRLKSELTPGAIVKVKILNTNRHSLDGELIK